MSACSVGLFKSKPESLTDWIVFEIDRTIVLLFPLKTMNFDVGSSDFYRIVQMPVGLNGSLRAAISLTCKPCRMILNVLRLPAAQSA